MHLVKLNHILKALHYFWTPHILYINLEDRILRYQIREKGHCSNHQKLVFKTFENRCMELREKRNGQIKNGHKWNTMWTQSNRVDM
jgi:hypothetical protein